MVPTKVLHIGNIGSISFGLTVVLTGAHVNKRILRSGSKWFEGPEHEAFRKNDLQDPIFMWSPQGSKYHYSIYIGPKVVI